VRVIPGVSTDAELTPARDEEQQRRPTRLDDCLSMRCGSELGEDVLFDDSGQPR
jgi:hypothetical protein